MIPLFYPLMPGMIAALLITGGHGGTKADEKIAAVVAAVVNAFAYFLIVVSIRAAWRACFRDENFLAKSKQKDSTP